MTMPHERFRSIGWGCELLAALQRDPGVPRELQQAAARLQATYPTSHKLIELLQNPGREFPAAAGQAIEDARVLFEQAQQLGVGSDETRRHLLFTMRHFPLRGWAAIADQAARLQRLDEWLLESWGDVER